MEKEGKYIYCIIGLKQERHFGPIGIGGRGDEVSTIGYNDLSMVVSNHPMTKFVVNQENLLAHERVIEEVMKEFDSVLPIRFGTIASDADEIRKLLDKRYRELTHILTDMDYKVELGVRGMWKNMETIFKDIVRENREIRRAKEDIQNEGSKKNLQAEIEVGKLVAEALVRKKEKEQELIVDTLRRMAFDYKVNKTAGDEMFMNASFLVDKGRVKEFDNVMDDLSEKYKDKIQFVYVGPLPVFNFVNIAIYLEEWEK